MVEFEVDVVVAEVEIKAVEVGLTLVVETVEANRRDGKREQGGGGGRHGGSGGHGVARSGGGAGEDGGGVVERFSDSVFRI